MAITTYSTNQDIIVKLFAFIDHKRCKEISHKEVHEGLQVLLFTMEDKGYKAKTKKKRLICVLST